MSRGYWIGLPRLRTFMGIMSLQTGTELACVALAFNKAIGLCGLLACVTGFGLSALQLSMYIYSVLCFAALIYLLPYIRRQTPFHNLSLAWLYILDTVISSGYTTAFSVAWFMVGFHNPNGTAGAISSVSVLSASAATAGPYPTTTLAANGTHTAPAGSGSTDAQVRETAVSMVIITALTLVRLYLAVVVAANARAAVLRAAEGRPVRARSDSHDPSGNPPRKAWRAANPFAEGTQGGMGWMGRLGRLMVAVGEGYWLGSREDEEWTRDVSSKFRSGRGQAERRAGPR